MVKWLIDVEDIVEEVEFDTLKDVENYILENISIREADEEGCEL